MGKQAFARQHADWLIGINLTRFISIGNMSLFSIGRVQTALVSAINERNKEVENFVSATYFEVEAKISDGLNLIKATLINQETKKTSFDTITTYLKEAGQFCKGRKIDRKESNSSKKINKPEKLLNITNLQKIAFKLYGYPPDKTLAIAQSLYEKHRCLSYPRTPSRVMGNNNVDLVKSIYEKLKDEYPEYSQYCNTHLINENNKHIFNSSELEDHHAFIPLKQIPQTAVKEEINVFTIVARSFFMVLMDDHIYLEKQTFYFIDKFCFKAVYKEIVESGWKQVIEKRQDDEQEIKQQSENENFFVKDINTLEKKTSPKKNYTLDTLLTFMENPHDDAGKLVGLGTAATRGEIIATIFERGYVIDKSKKLFVTEKGKYLLEQLNKSPQLKKMSDIAQTTIWEKKICDDPESFEQEIKVYLNDCIKQTEIQQKFMKSEIAICPLCGNKVLEGKENYYCIGYKNEPKCTFTIWKKVLGTSISTDDLICMLSGKKTKLKTCKSKNNKSFKAHLSLDKEGKIELAFQNKTKGRAI